MNVYFVSLGCDKNTVDSEQMLGLLEDASFNIVLDEEQAEVIVINTCCFIHDAKEESIDTILELAQLKKTAKLELLVVTGCLAQRYEKEIREEIPEVDVILGTSSYDEIVEAIKDGLKGKKVSCMKELSYLPQITHRVKTTAPYTSYLKIAEGCNKCCSYCVIPQIRGQYRSVPKEVLMEEAKRLVEAGTKELVLVAQETTLYGVDLYGKRSLPELLKMLSSIEDLSWIRILYCYPEEMNDELIEAMVTLPKVCHYVDMPIQHSENTILSAMGRRTTKEELIEKIKTLRERIPDIAIRTTLITGFPGETEEDYEALYRFVNAMEFERLGIFTYSKEEGTRAAEMDHQVQEEVKEFRRNELMELQQEISSEFLQSKIGKTFDVLVEGYLYDEDVYVGRTYMDAPKVDGCVFFKSEEEIISGEIVKVKITDANEYDLIGEVNYEFTK